MMRRLGPAAATAAGKRFLLAATMLAGVVISSPASAVVLLATDVNATGTTPIQGFVDIGQNTTLIPGLTASLELTYTGLSNGGLTWGFNYEVTNTTQGINGLTSRLSSFGLTTTPDTESATISGSAIWNFAVVGVNIPIFQPSIDFCASGNANQCSSGVGLAPGESDDGSFTITFDSVLAQITLDNAFARFQSIDGSVFDFRGASGVGFDPVVITPFSNPVPLPAAAWLFLSGLFGLGALGWKRRRSQTA